MNYYVMAANGIVSSYFQRKDTKVPAEKSHSAQRQGTQAAPVQHPVKQKEVPIYQYLLPLPSTPQRNDKQQLLVCGGNGGIGGGVGQLSKDNNRSNLQTLHVTLVWKKGSQLFLKGRAMTSSGRSNQTMLPIKGLSKGHVSPRQRGSRKHTTMATVTSPREPQDRDSSEPGQVHSFSSSIY